MLYQLWFFRVDTKRNDVALLSQDMISETKRTKPQVYKVAVIELGVKTRHRIGNKNQACIYKYVHADTAVVETYIGELLFLSSSFFPFLLLVPSRMQT